MSKVAVELFRANIFDKVANFDGDYDSMAMDPSLAGMPVMAQPDMSAAMMSSTMPMPAQAMGMPMGADPVMGAVNELSQMELVDDDNLTFGEVADSGCPVTQELLEGHPELADLPYNETVKRAQAITGMVPAAPAAGGSAMNWALPLGGVGIGAIGGGLLGNYLGNRFDFNQPAATAIGAGLGGIGGLAGGYLLDRYLNS